MTSLDWLADTLNLTPRGFCLNWEPALLWLAAGSDAITTLAYVSIPLAALWFVHRRQDLPHRWAALLFAAFFLAAAATHVMSAATLWLPIYHAELAVRLAAAALAVAAAGGAWALVPRLLALPSPARLEALNRALQNTQTALRSQNKDLDRRVGERTEQLVRLNDTISRNETRLRQVVEAAPTVMVMVGTTGRIEMVNEQTERMFGYSRLELLGCPVEILIPDRVLARHPGLRPAFWGEPQAAPQTALTMKFGVKKNGCEFPVEIRLNPIETEHGVKMLCAIVDISDRVRAAAELEQARDRAEQASLAKSRFLAGVSHDLRTPLNGIMGYAQLLQMEGRLDLQQKDRVDGMLAAGQHLLDTINSVRDLAEIEAERLSLQVAQFDLHDVVAKCVAFVQPAADEKALELSFTIDFDPPHHVMGDRIRLQQVLVALLGNAVKFTPRGRVELRVEAGAEPEVVSCTILDTGPGIPVEQVNRMFQYFERLDAHVASPVEGLGLGLALSVRLVALMGGKLRYEDKPGGGSVFCLDVPLPACAVATVAVTAAPADSGRAGDQLRHILVVDDVAMSRDIASSFLRSAGHTVSLAEDGAEAVNAVATEDFDLVLMDLRMPEVDGLEATRRIRKLEGVRGSVPIIGLTAEAFVQQVRECRRAGMDGHLSKPFTLDGLLQMVGRAPELAAQRAAAVASGKLTAPKTETPHQSRRSAAANQPTFSELAAAALEPAASLEVFDRAKFDRTTAHLSPEVVLSCLNTLVERAEILLSKLPDAEMQAGISNSLAAAAHTLAGSAGMFGFDRLCATARQFERAVDTNITDASMPTADLIGVLKASLVEMQKCPPVRTR